MKLAKVYLMTNVLLSIHQPYCLSNSCEKTICTNYESCTPQKVILRLSTINRIKNVLMDLLRHIKNTTKRLTSKNSISMAKRTVVAVTAEEAIRRALSILQTNGDIKELKKCVEQLHEYAREMDLATSKLGDNDRDELREIESIRRVTDLKIKSLEQLIREIEFEHRHNGSNGSNSDNKCVFEEL